MKKLLQILFLFITFQAHGQSVFVLSPASDFLNCEASGVAPGDEIHLEAGTYTNLTINNCQGTWDSVIVVKPLGQVIVEEDGITLNNDKYLDFNGEYNPEYPLGIRVQKTPQIALGMSKGSTNIAIHGVQIGGELYHEDSAYSIYGAGMHIHTPPICSELFNTHPNFVMDSILIYNCLIQYTSTEGIYLGHSKYFGVTANCGNGDTTLIPHQSTNVKIFNNEIRYTGWDGMQASIVVDGLHVFGNKIHHTGLEQKPAQAIGLVIGGGTKNFLVSDNQIWEGNGGIHLFGTNGYVVNNYIYTMGYRNELEGVGIFIGDKIENEDSWFIIMQNRLGFIKGFGVDINHSLYDSDKDHLLKDNSFFFIEDGFFNFQGGVDRNRWILENNITY